MQCVRDDDVVIGQAVDDEERPREIRGQGQQRGPVVVLGLLLRQAEAVSAARMQIRDSD